MPDEDPETAFLAREARMPHVQPDEDYPDGPSIFWPYTIIAACLVIVVAVILAP